MSGSLPSGSTAGVRDGAAPSASLRDERRASGGNAVDANFQRAPTAVWFRPARNLGRNRLLQRPCQTPKKSPSLGEASSRSNGISTPSFREQLMLILRLSSQIEKKHLDGKGVSPQPMLPKHDNGCKKPRLKVRNKQKSAWWMACSPFVPHAEQSSSHAKHLTPIHLARTHVYAHTHAAACVTREKMERGEHARNPRHSGPSSDTVAVGAST